MQLTEETARELLHEITELKELIRNKRQPSTPYFVQTSDINYVTTKQAAEMLAVSPKTILNMIKDRQLEALSIRSGWSIAFSSIRRFIETRTIKAKK